MIGSGSSFDTDSTASVGWPLTSLTPKISEAGKVVSIWTLKEGEVVGSSTSSAASLISCEYVSGVSCARRSSIHTGSCACVPRKGNDNKVKAKDL